MSNSYFQFKQFTIHQDRCAMKVTTDACLFGAWVSEEVRSWESGVGSWESGAGSWESGVGKILDIGTGTGLLTLMLAQKINASIDAIELDKDAFEQAKENIAASPWAGRIKVFHGDAREFAFPAKYDIIISNPPFYENELKSDDDKKNMAHHGGLSLIELLQAIFKNLETGGQFYLMLPFKRMQETGFLLQKYKLAISHVTWIKQSTQHGHFRLFIAGKHTSKDEEPDTRNEIAVWNEKQEYTKEFTELLKDYYLYL